MLDRHASPRARAAPRLHVGLACCESEVIEAQRLRYRVFADELGARLQVCTPGVDQDVYDPFCDHLIVWDEQRGRIVGTYRILSPGAARRVGGYYSENEFDLTRLRHLRGNIVEVGRSCIDADYRSGAVISLLWAGLIRYMLHGRYEHLIGCASISMVDGGHGAAGICGQIDSHLAPLEYRVFPRLPLPTDRLKAIDNVELPPLLRGYLRAGAWVCGDPAWDPDFNTADLLLMMPMSRISARYAKHFVERQS